VISAEALLELTAGHIRAMGLATGEDALVANVEVHQEPEKLSLSNFAVMTFHDWPNDTYRCDKLLNQLKVRDANDVRFVLLTYVEGEVRLEYINTVQSQLCPGIVARCELK